MPSAASIVPFSFLGCSHALLGQSSSPSSSSSAEGCELLSHKSAAAAVLCSAPRGDGCLLLFLRLQRPVRIRRIALRNSGAAFLSVLSVADERQLTECCLRCRFRPPQPLPLSPRRAALLLSSFSFSSLVPEHQLCAADSPQQAVLTFPSRAQGGRFSALCSAEPAVGIAIQLRGAVDAAAEGQTIGLAWLELYGSM